MLLKVVILILRVATVKNIEPYLIILISKYSSILISGLPLVFKKLLPGFWKYTFLGLFLVLS